MKIALIQCPLWGTYEPPVAIAQLSSCLKKEGHEVMALDLNIKLYLNSSNEYKNFWAWEQSDFWYKQDKVKDYFSKISGDINYYIDFLLKEKITLVGFSVNIASLNMSYEFAKKLKTVNKDIKIVFGGPLFLNKKYISNVLNSDAVDMAIIGEGEYSICKLADAIAKNQGISLVPGIAFKKNEEIVVNKSANAVDLNSLPFLDFSDLPLKNYDDSRHISLMASRGCVKRCYFCSDAPCWPGYRAMSGERIFNEIAFHKNIHNDIGHVRFLDLEFNGNIKSLIRFCDLMKDKPLDVNWSANMIIRPEMTKKVIKKMARAGCEHIIFGIESGSERILKIMNKNYSMKDADRIIKQMHESGICVTANFMFGFPGETEEDFNKTLDFIKRNAKFLDRVYPSRTYFALEEFSYVYDHHEEFHIKSGYSGHLYWESIDGLNTYPVRMDRCRRFCELAIGLGIEVGSGVQTSVLQDEWFNLANYYEIKEGYSKAVEYFLEYHKMDPYNNLVNNKISLYNDRIKSGEFEVPWDIKERLTNSMENIINPHIPHKDMLDAVKLENSFSKALLRSKIRNLNNLIKTEEYNEKNKELFYSEVNKLIVIMNDNHGYGIPDIAQDYADTMRALAGKNSALNNEEFGRCKSILFSSPKTFFLQFAGPCNASCVFCSRGHGYGYFELAKFKTTIESKIAYELALAEQFIFTGSGEFLRLPDWKEILNYFEPRYSYIEKIFSTNGSSLRSEAIDLITSHRSRYSIHVSLHASNAKLHKIITRMDNFDKILNNIKYLIECRKKNNNVKIDLFFVVTTLNMEDLPNFVRLAGKLGVDSVIVNYNYVYIPTQKYLSSYFKQELTNQMFNEAELVAQKIGIKIILPPRFGLNNYPETGICRELWSQVMLDGDGHVLPCDASHGCDLKLEENVNFDNIWNSEYYIKIRQELMKSKRTKCYQYCHRANPVSVNLFPSHVIHRGREENKIDESWEDNF